MTNRIDINQHVRLFKQEFLLQQAEFEKKLKSNATKLREAGELYISKFAGYDDTRGFIILKFSTEKPFPRKGEQLCAFIPSEEDSRPVNWTNKTYEQILQNKQRMTSLTPVWFQQGGDNRLLIGFSGCSEEFLHGLQNNIPVFLGPAEPPIQYLLNLIHLLESRELYPRFKETIDIELAGARWSPEPLENNENTALLLSADLHLSRDIIIQGPPGTGKSYLIAQICNLYLRQNKKILISSLTNKALTEIVEKEGLSSHLEAEKIFKTSLSLDEQRKYKKLKPGSDFSFEGGTLLLSSYYHLSELAKNASGALFDLVILEEASQTFLATIGAGRHLGEKLLIVGDQKQMQPIRMISNQDLEHPNLQMAFEGLIAFSKYFKNIPQFILNESFRLKSNAIHLTNSFYNNQLKSAQIEQNEKIFPDGFDQSKNIILRPLNLIVGIKLPTNAINILIDDFLSFYHLNPKSEFAVLTFYKITVKELQLKIIQAIGFKDNIVVETIDRVQGLTVDFCFFLIPNTGLSFSLNPNRFNVATSRAKQLTLIYTPINLDLNGFDEEVKEYFNRING